MRRYQRLTVGMVLCSVLCMLFAGRTFPSPRDHPPERIVSLVPAVTEELYLLRAQNRIVGVTIYCQRPPEAQHKERVGTVVDVNVEKILALQPDLIVASELIDPRQLAKLKKLGLRVELISQGVKYDELCANFMKLGRLIGREEDALRITSKARSELQRLGEHAKACPTPRVFVQIGADPLFTSGKKTLINAMIETAGGINIADDIMGSSVYSREQVIRGNPDIILIVTMGVAKEREQEVWMRYNTIKAVKQGRIHMIDPYAVCSPTPVSYVGTVKELTRIFCGI